MGEAIFDLEELLRARKEKLTVPEANIMLKWKATAMSDFMMGFGGGSVVTWLATRRINKIFRVNLTLSAAAVCGLWSFRRSVDKCLDHILSLEGSRIQSELANIILKKYYDNPSVLRRLSKHFYSEEVYDDSSPDKPNFRWRFRNFSGETISPSQRASSDSDENDSKKSEVEKKTIGEPKNVGSKQVKVNVPGDDAEYNPFDFIFRPPVINENTPPLNTSSTPSSVRQSRKERRSRRRRRRHHQEESDSEI